MSRIPGPSRIPTFGPRKLESNQYSNLSSTQSSTDLIDNITITQEINILEQINEKDVALSRESSNPRLNAKRDKTNQKPYSKHVKKSKNEQTQSPDFSPSIETITTDRQSDRFESIEAIPPPYLVPSDVPIIESSDGALNQEKRPTSLELGEFILNKEIETKKVISLLTANDDDQRDSLDMDESLGILTPDQMKTSFPNFSEGFSFPYKSEKRDQEIVPVCSQVSSPGSNVGIFDRKSLANVTLICDTTINLELSFDVDNIGLARLEQTPSPEELPLDPTPVIEDPKTKSKSSNSFVTSVTSITSLDTGYQGDGEMSRPGSRAAENSPLTRRPVQRPQPRRPDPMTDSDFYTESDVDNHEENVIRGDRKAQVIDGTLYGIDPQKAADIYVNNRETMDSSGIFTDLETRTDDLIEPMNVDISPSEISSKTVSENSQNLQEVRLIQAEANQNLDNKRRSTAASNSSPVSRENSGTKNKTLKKEVSTKVKSSLEKKTETEKKVVKKNPGRWDAVMNKISKTDHTTNIKNVKSRVFNSPSVPNELRKVSSARQISTPKTSSAKLRRVRSRALPTREGGSNYSSLSDLSASPQKKIHGSAKSKEQPQVTQVLTASKLTPKVNSFSEGKQVPLTPPQAKLPRTRLFQNGVSKNTGANINRKEFGRNAKGAKTSPTAKAPITRSVAKSAPKTAEALAILVQHLVFNVEAFQAPTLKRQVQKLRQQKEQLEQELSAVRQQHSLILEEHQLVKRNEIAVLLENQCRQINEVLNEKNELERRLIQEFEIEKRRNDLEVNKLKDEYANLQKTHESFVNILREENDAIREEMDEKNAKIQEQEKKTQKLIAQLQKDDVDTKIDADNLQRENKMLRDELARSRQKQKEESERLEEENVRLSDENERLRNYGKGVDVREIESIRAVLDLKIKELADLRQICAKATHRAETLANCEERNAMLQAKCEDLQDQLRRQKSFREALLNENEKLNQSMKEELKIRRRLTQKNEELQWHVQQNKEIITKIVQQTNDAFNRFGLDDHSISTMFKSTLDLSFPLKLHDDVFQSTPLKGKDLPPNVKGVVEKSDSVSYVLDLHETPDVIASRIVRRSFRNSTPPRNTPIKSPLNKRTKIKSSSSHCSEDEIMVLDSTSKHSGKRNGSCQADFGSSEIDEHFDLNEDIGSLPAIPTGLGSEKSQSLPSPKYLANEESCSLSSDDECTSSSSGQL